ncbi:monocarboxylate transporter 12-like [Patiria miniata]|uniref:Monocarboxylate transporter n=1 Tax=Patiria miniata TaxID=46514 RepID=A0A913ZM06_PATMI|nr:monocarboxylate transporter 12-like [Patiria miniata]
MPHIRERLASTAPAVGVSNIVTRELIGQCYPETHTRAFGIGASGGSLAFVVIAPLTQFLLDVYGWRGATMLLGSLLSHLVICGALFRTNQKTGKRNGDYELVTGGTSAVDSSQKRHSVLATMKDIFKIDLFTSPKYWLVVFVFVCTTVTNTAWVVYFALNATLSKSFSLADAAAFLTVFGVAKIVGNLLTGLFDSCKAVGTNAWMGLSLFASSACYLVDPILVSYWSIMVYVFIYGCFHSFLYTLMDVIAKESVGLGQLGSALGWIGLKAGLVRALILFFPGLIYDTFGSYTLAFILMAAINALALVGLLVLARLQRRE